MSIYCGRSLVFRIYVDLPDAENRVKILRIFLAQETLEPKFQFEKLADATEGYSGSDLKVMPLNVYYDLDLHPNFSYFCILQNLCIAAAYRPVQELLEEEKKVTAKTNCLA